MNIMTQTVYFYSPTELIHVLSFGTELSLLSALMTTPLIKETPPVMTKVAVLQFREQHGF